MKRKATFTQHAESACKCRGRASYQEPPHLCYRSPSIEKYEGAKPVRDRPHIVSLAKRVIPRASRAFSSTAAQRAISLAETASAILQGKGAGSGWDLAAEIRAYKPFLHQGAVLFDVGANIGEWSATAVDYGNLYMFEPQEGCRAHLERIVARGAVLVPAAVGSAEREAEFFVPSGTGTGGNASLHMRRDTYFDDTTFASTKVKVITIDGFMARSNIDLVDFMKMDIEGNELAALQGAKEALKNKAIRALSFEFGSGNINSRTFFHDFWDLLTGYGYNIYRVLPAGKLLRITRYDEDLEYFRGVSNYVAAF
jgi:FkbM family methyltransferase